MIGLIVIVFFVIYILVCIFAVWFAAWCAKRYNRNPWIWGLLTTFVMYNLVFWDWIPTVIAHKYYCETQAGFFVYKTPEQWKAENPSSTAEAIKPLGKNINDMPSESLNLDGEKFSRKLSQKLYLVYISNKDFSILPITKYNDKFYDKQTGETIAEFIDFKSGYGNPMTTEGGVMGFKTWLAISSCGGSTGGEYERGSGYIAFLENIIELGAQK